MQYRALFVGIFLMAGLTTGSRYEVSVYTGDRFGAGTDAGVFITLYGKKRSSSEMELNSNKNDFERGSVDTFNIESPELGKVTSVGVRHDNKWLGSSWFLHKITVKTSAGCVYEFPCDKWLASKGNISRVLHTKSRCINKGTADCREALGVSSGEIKDVQITASSSYDDQHRPYHARLNRTVKGSRGGWCSAFADTSEYLEIDLGRKHIITGIATQGQSEFDNWVTTFIMAFSLDGVHWEPLKDKDGLIRNLTGNSDRNTVVRHWFPGLKSQYVRVEPTAWSGLTNCLRVELFGCKNDTLHDSVKGRSPNKAKQKGQAKYDDEINAVKQDEYPKLPEKEHDANLNIMSVIEKAVMYLGFERIVKDNVIVDASEQHNNAKIVNFARIARFSENCGNGVDLNGGDILLDGATFHKKPQYAVTIAVWVKMFSIQGSNSIFDTIGGINSTHDNGQYHFEIVDGSIRWFHRNERNDVIFNVTSEVVVSSHVWTHLAVTYDSRLGQADIYVNAKFIMRVDGSGELSRDWEEKAGIGEHKGERLLAGLIDEFYMSTDALSQEEIKKLMQHCAFEKECFLPLGMESMKVMDKQMTASSTYKLHKPFYGRLNLVSFYDDPRRTAWCADEDDKAPYLTVDLREVKTISGVAIQGASVSDDYVTSFKLCHSVNGRRFDCVGESEAMESLQGNEDKDSVMIHWLERFFDARYIRVYPLSWYGENICLRIELYGCITGLLSDSFSVHTDTGGRVNSMTMWESFGDCSVSCGQGTKRRVRKCQLKRGEINENCYNGKHVVNERVPCTRPSCPECFTPMKMSDGMLVVRDILGSLNIGGSQAFLTQQTERKSWCAKEARRNQFLEIDLEQARKVTGVGTQGEVTDTGDQWVMRYYITYSLNGKQWNNYTEDNRPRLFRGNEDSNTIAVRHLNHPVTARYVRIQPLLWHGVRICMRVQIYGCDHASNSLKPLNTQSKVKNAPVTQKSQHRGTGQVPAKFEYNVLPFVVTQNIPDKVRQNQKDDAHSSITQHVKAIANPHAPPKPTSSIVQSIVKLRGPLLIPSTSAVDARKFYGINALPSHELAAGPLQNSAYISLAIPSEEKVSSLHRTDVVNRLPPSQNKVRQGSISAVQSVLPVQGHVTKSQESTPPTFTRSQKLSLNNSLISNVLSNLSDTNSPEQHFPALLNGSVIFHTQSQSPTESKLQKPGTDKLSGSLLTNMTAVQHEPSAFSWSPFHKCSVTCGEGVKTRYRKCSAMECQADGVETEILPCYESPCPRDASQWSAYSPCPVTCGVGRRTRFRLCDGVVCPKSGKETDTISCTLPPCPVLYLGFEKWESEVVLDGSNMGNNAFLEKGARIVAHRGFCGHFADLWGSSEIILEDNTFRRKPRDGITIAAWTNLQGVTKGLHTLFSTARSIRMGQIIGGYHFEIDDGRVRWFHRSRFRNPVFSVMTEEIIPSNVWSHIVGTYNATTGEAKVYVDSLLRGSARGYGFLDTQWGYKASIGNFDLGERHLRGWVDDFYMFDYAVSARQIEQLLTIQCPPKTKTRLAVT